MVSRELLNDFPLCYFSQIKQFAMDFEICNCYNISQNVQDKC